MAPVHVKRLEGRIVRVPLDETAKLKLDLAADERLLSVEMKQGTQYAGRRTVDWRWVAYIEVSSPRRRRDLARAGR